MAIAVKSTVAITLKIAIAITINPIDTVRLEPCTSSTMSDVLQQAHFIV